MCENTSRFVGELSVAKVWLVEEKLIGRRFPTYAESLGCDFSVDLEEVCCQKIIALDMSQNFFVVKGSTSQWKARGI